MKNLKDLKIWLCWNFASRAGKVTKVPISATGGTTGTSNEYEETWVTYDEAIAAARENGYDGVGFIITPGVFFIDIDHCDISDPFVQSILKCVPTYAECSVSGEGIHIYGKCDPAMIPTYIDKDGASHLSRVFYQKNPNNGVEIYFGDLTNRYAVFTGNVIQDRDIVDCTDGVLKVLDMAMRRPDRQDAVPKSEPLAAPPVAADTDEVIAGLRTQKNAMKFEQLFDRGDITGFNSQSEADVSLCALIAFRAGPYPDVIDAVFRRSALYRGKWDRDDYREATINAGINACRGTFYLPNKLKPANMNTGGESDGSGNMDTGGESDGSGGTCFVYLNDRGKPTVNPALLARHVRENVVFKRVRNAATQGVMTYVYEDGVYRPYSDEMMMGVIKSFVINVSEALLKMSQVKEVLQNINSDLTYYTTEDFDADENVINFQNGLLYIYKDHIELRPHTPDVLSTIQIPCEWTGVAKETPVFTEFLNTLTNENKDVQQLLIEFTGICISNIKGHRFKKAMFLVGPGDTGKSKILEFNQRLVGKNNYIGIDLSEIEARFGTAAIFGKRLIGSADMNYMSVKELKTFKKLTGGDSVFAEFKCKDAFEYTFSGVMMFCMNDLPKFSGDEGEWVYNRIMPVWCPNVIPKDKQDKFITDKMMVEAEGIVYQAVMALCNVIANGYNFTEPACVSDARKEYAIENNTVLSFFTECMCEILEGGPDKTYSVQDIYEIYKAWCKHNNHGYEKTMPEFRKDITHYLGAADYSDIVTHIKGKAYFKYYRLLPEAGSIYGRDRIIN